MEPPEPAPDPRFDEIARRLTYIERRLAAVERSASAHGALAASDDEGFRDEHAGAALLRAAAPQQLAAGTLQLVGRSLVVLAGAFLVRAATEAGTVPAGAGIALGLVYAAAWIVLADRAIVAGHQASAAFHGLASAAIAFPLLFEATARFKFLSPPASAMALAGVMALALFVAWRRDLARLAWVFALGATATALALAAATRSLLPFVSFLLGLGLVTLWLGYLRGWRTLGWTIAVAVDAAVALVLLIPLVARTPQAREVLDPAWAVGLALAVAIAYFGSFALRTLTAEDPVGPFEVLQGGAVFFLGLVGAAAVTRAAALPAWPLGLTGLLLAAAGYSAAFAYIDRRASRGDFIYYTTLALGFTLIALAELIEGPARAPVLGLAALACAWIGSRRARATLSLHAAVYVVAAALTSGAALGALRALGSRAAGDAGWISLPALLSIGVAAACCLFPVAAHGRTWGRLSSLPMLVLLAVLALGVAGLAVVLGTRLVPDDPGALAALRTGVLAAGAVALAALGRVPRWPEATWLVYPVLVAGGAKLLFVDLRSGRAATLFVSLALYGVALIAAPRLARR